MEAFASAENSVAARFQRAQDSVYLGSTLLKPT